MSTTGSRGTGAKSAVKAFGAVAVCGIALSVISVVLKYAFEILTTLGVWGGWLTFIGLVGAAVSGIVVLATSKTPAESPTTTSPIGLAPGWYPDQTDPNLRRYYDGHTWTSGTAPRE